VNQGPSPLQVEHDKLRPDVVTIRQYGESHPEAWVELRFENEPIVRIVVLLAGDDAQVHERALRCLVAYPDQLEVRGSPWPLNYLNEIREYVHEIGRTRTATTLQGDGITNGRLYVKLVASQVELAAELHDRYGDAIDLTVGRFPFPDAAVLSHDGAAEERTKQERPLLLPPDQIQISIPEGLEIKSGDTITSVLQAQNFESNEIAITTGLHLIAHIVDPETQEVVGGYSGAVATVARRFEIPPGESADIPLLIALESAVPRLGYAIPPGRWAVDTELRLGDRGVFRTPPLSISVVQ
jgi:hypothetical protein